tara:strand:- start:377 stop:493 length:117 start_codon:yes stop_codon:yes gene_type:complete
MGYKILLEFNIKLAQQNILRIKKPRYTRLFKVDIAAEG